MNSQATRAVGVAALAAAAALSLTSVVHEVGARDVAPPPSSTVPTASEVFGPGTGQSEGNVQDMTY